MPSARAPSRKRVEAASNGRDRGPALSQPALGDEKPMLDGMRLGTVDAGVITNAVIAQIEPAFQLNDLPFLYANEAQAHRVLDGPVGQKLAAKLEAQGRDAARLDGGRLPQHDQQRPAGRASPRIVRGVKYRVMQNPVFIEHVPQPRRQRRADGLGRDLHRRAAGRHRRPRDPARVIDQNKYYEVTKYLSLTGHIYSMIGLLMAKRTFDRLPEDLKKVVIEVAVSRHQGAARGGGRRGEGCRRRAREGRHEGQPRHRLQAVPRFGGERL